MLTRCKTCNIVIKSFPFASKYREVGYCRLHIPDTILKSLQLTSKKKKKRKVLVQCKGITKSGQRCRNRIRPPKDTCRIHTKKPKVKPKDYNKYISSNSWAKKSKSIRSAFDNQCRLCNRTGLIHAHHRTYKRLGDELPEDLTPLCVDCHDLFGHFFTYKRKKESFEPCQHTKKLLKKIRGKK